MNASERLMAWFGNNSWRMSEAAKAEAWVWREFPDLERGSEEFYEKVLERAKSGDQ